MKKLVYYMFLMVLPFVFTSCLNDDQDAEHSTACDITNIAFEHRWAVESEKVLGIWTLKFKELNVSKFIDTEAAIVTVDITVPAADNSFPETEREKVSLSSLACSFFVSNAASVQALDNAPSLGTLADFSGKTFKYRVKSASGVYKDWQIKINSFTK